MMVINPKFSLPKTVGSLRIKPKTPQPSGGVFSESHFGSIPAPKLSLSGLGTGLSPTGLIRNQ